MEQIIRFRMLANQLDDGEFIQFLTKTVKTTDGRDLIMNCLFKHFLDCHQNQRQLRVLPLTDCISEIITQRNPKQEEPPSLDNVTRLPAHLISELASYLKAPEYITFSRCNRKIYVGCNSPCKIYHMPTCLLKKYPFKRSMAKFKPLRCLGLNIPFFNREMTEANQQTWRDVQLHTLQLSNRAGTENDLNCFLRNGYIGDTVNLKLHKFGRDATSPYSAKSFCELLARFDMIEHLLLWDVWLTEEDTDYKQEDIRTWLPNLKGFGFTGGHNQALSQCIIRSLAPQLEALRIEGMEWAQIDKVSFPKLVELSLSMCQSRILDVFAKVDSLQSVMISSSKEDIICKFISIMVAQPLMRHVHIKSPAKLLGFAMERAEVCLFETRSLERGQSALQIIFDGNNWGEDTRKMRDLHHQLFRLINTLEKSTVSDFIVRVKVTSKRDIERECSDIEEWLQELERMERDYLVDREFSKKKETYYFIFTVSNKRCKVNGYRYSWKMWSSSL